MIFGTFLLLYRHARSLTAGLSPRMSLTYGSPPGRMRRSGSLARNAEVIRQWQILREIESRRTGVTIHELARLTGVSTRTIRRDLQALQEAGFSVFDEGEENETKKWRLEGSAFRSVEEGLTVADVAALYLSRAMVEGLSGWPLADELRETFAKIERALNPRMREFLSTLPQVLSAKAGPRSSRPVSAHGRHHAPALRRHARSPRRRDALFLGREQPREDIHGGAVPADAGARRCVSRRLGSAVPRSSARLPPNVSRSCRSARRRSRRRASCRMICSVRHWVSSGATRSAWWWSSTRGSRRSCAAACGTTRRSSRTSPMDA